MDYRRKKYIDDPWLNIIVLGLSILVFTGFTMSAPDLERAGLGGLANLFFPGVIGLGTMLFFDKF